MLGIVSLQHSCLDDHSKHRSTHHFGSIVAQLTPLLVTTFCWQAPLTPTSSTDCGDKLDIPLLVLLKPCNKEQEIHETKVFHRIASVVFCGVGILGITP